MAAPPPSVEMTQAFASGASLRFGKSGAKSNMSAANSVIFSVRDASHPVLSAQLIGKARSIFATYCSMCEQPPASVISAAGNNINREASIVLPQGQGIDLTTADEKGAAAAAVVDQQQPAGLNAKGVQRYMADVGCSVSENEAKDIIFALSQSGVILHKNAEVERLSADGAEARSNMMSCRSLATDTSEAAAGASRNLVLTFPLFLELLMSTQSDCSADDEIQSTWSRMDKDGDGVLGVDDIRETLAGLSYTAGGTDLCTEDLQVLAQMSAIELQTLLREYDLDADGAVTYDDFRKAVETS
jgi:Ca2+-binding EF-hand superfamily protein